jgi:formylglycine-generating enzyme required for sulfatase activity
MTARWVYDVVPGAGDLAELTGAAQDATSRGDHDLAATAWDRAWALDSTDPGVTRHRATALDQLALTEQGLRFRYVPGGSYLIGSSDGDPDEQPAHVVRLDPFWLADEPVNWTAYCALMGWQAPPAGYPQDPDPAGEDADRDERFLFSEGNKIRLQYCENLTTRAVDWHAHAAAYGNDERMLGFFGQPPREDPGGPARFDRKPMVAVSWHMADDLATRLTAQAQEAGRAGITYRLPHEAEWEAAARGGLAGRRYPWGDEPPGPGRADCDRFTESSLVPLDRLSPNGYGLRAMSGSVWEWTCDWYDAGYYAHSPRVNPPGPDADPSADMKRVIRGGSWTDHPATVTVSFRSAHGPTRRFKGRLYSSSPTPNIGFRLCRTGTPS